MFVLVSRSQTLFQKGGKGSGSARLCLSRAVHRRSLKRGLVYEEWIHFWTIKRLYTWMNENEEIYQVVSWISCLLLSTYS